MSAYQANQEKEAGWGWVAGFAALAVFVRLVPYYFLDLSPTAKYLWNLTPVGALGLFVGAHLRGRVAYLVPLGVMLVSDLLLMVKLGSSAFDWVTPFTYASLTLNVVIGRLLATTFSPLWVVPNSLLTATQFFFVTNFAFWALNGGGFYAKTLEGLMACYVAALPFFKNTLAGDMLYSGLFFGLFAVVQAVTSRQKVSQPA